MTLGPGLRKLLLTVHLVSSLGWLGAANYDYDAAEMSAVLRSWEERFGAVPVCLDFDVPHRVEPSGEVW